MPKVELVALDLEKVFAAIQNTQIVGCAVRQDEAVLGLVLQKGYKLIS